MTLIMLWLLFSGYCPVRDSLLSIAEAELGVIETSENFSPRIYEYQLACGWQTPVPWCACFISFVYGQLNLPTPRYGAAAKSWTESNRIEYTRQVMPGDVGSVYYSRLGRVGHAFIIEATDADNCYTIEGNTRPFSVLADDREGDRVMRRVRPWGTVYRFANWIGDISHIIMPGENLYRISLKYKVPIEQIRTLNNINGDYIRVGEVLVIECP